MERSEPPRLAVDVALAHTDLGAAIAASNANCFLPAPATRNSAPGTNGCLIEVPLPQISDAASGFSSPTSLLRGFGNFRRSALPSRFLFFADGSWDEVARQVFDVLHDGFASGKTALEVPVDGIVHVFDFLRMVCVNSETGAASPIAWIDVNGQCFFPGTSLDEQRKDAPCLKLEVEMSVGKDSLMAAMHSDCNHLKRRDFAEPNMEEQSDESPGISSTSSGQGLRWSKVEKLDNGDRFYRVVEKLFLAGMRAFAPDTIITAIHRCLHADPLGSPRTKVFQMMAQMTTAIRGDCNVKFGWYGAQAKDLAAAIDHGFGRPNNDLLRSDAHGLGIHLSPPNSPFPSSVLAEVDETGQRHLVLCRAVMGSPEKVEAGSAQFHPSSDAYDSGMDDLAHPRWYIVWSTHMNSRILPEYVVSFRSSKQHHGPWRPRRPSVGRLSLLPKLIAELGRGIPASKIQALGIAHSRYKQGKISKESFVRFLRAVVGDKLLAATIKRLRGC